MGICIKEVFAQECDGGEIMEKKVVIVGGVGIFPNAETYGQAWDYAFFTEKVGDHNVVCDQNHLCYFGL